MVRGAVTQKGRALSVREMWNFSPGITRIWPSKTEGNSTMIELAVGVGGASEVEVQQGPINSFWGDC